MKELEKVPKLAPGSDVAYIAAAQKSIFESNVDEAVRIAREGIGKGNQHFMLLALYGEAVILSGVEPRSRGIRRCPCRSGRAVEVSPTYVSARDVSRQAVFDGEPCGRCHRATECGAGSGSEKLRGLSNLAAAYRRRGDTAQAEEMLAILDKLNKEEIERIRNAPGDRKAGYMANPVTKK